MLQKPKNGGDTLFASTVGAYERLTPDQKKLVDSLEVVNRYASYSLPACEAENLLTQPVAMFFAGCLLLPMLEYTHLGCFRMSSLSQ